MKAPRDGVIVRYGLTAEFLFIDAHKTITDSSWVWTAFGEIQVKDALLTYDPPRDLSPEAAAVVAELTPKSKSD